MTFWILLSLDVLQLRYRILMGATVLVKFSCDTSQTSRKCPSPALLPPLNVVFRNFSSQSCESILRGQGGEICPILVTNTVGF